jgi:CRP-like cAMP-binding protein
LHVIGLADERRLDLPLTQTMLAEATGLTAVHVNRTLQRLRGDGLIHLSRRILTILDFDRLKEAAGFKANYLQIARRVR